MSVIVLDTNVVSELMKPAPSAAVVGVDLRPTSGGSLHYHDNGG